MQKNNMSSAAFLFGIASMILGLMCGMGTVFGGLGITLACLSRTDKMDTKALIGLITSIMGLVLSIVLLAASAILLYTSPELQDIMVEYYGYSFESDFPSNENSNDDSSLNGEDNNMDGYDSFEEYFYNEFFSDDSYYNFENYYENGGQKL